MSPLANKVADQNSRNRRKNNKQSVYVAQIESRKQFQKAIIEMPSEDQQTLQTNDYIIKPPMMPQRPALPLSKLNQDCQMSQYQVQQQNRRKSQSTAISDNCVQTTEIKPFEGNAPNSQRHYKPAESDQNKITPRDLGQKKQTGNQTDLYHKKQSKQLQIDNNKSTFKELLFAENQPLVQKKHRSPDVQNNDSFYQYFQKAPIKQTSKYLADKSRALGERKGSVMVNSKHIRSTSKDQSPTMSGDAPIGTLSNQSRSPTSISDTSENTFGSLKNQLINSIKTAINLTGKVPATTLQHYNIIKQIGQGAFGKVMLGEHVLTGLPVAIKQIEKNLIKQNHQKSKFLQEVQMMKKVRHPNICRLLEVFETETMFVLIMEYACRGDLLSYVRQQKRLEESSAKAMFTQIVFGLAHCHCKSVLHRDIKLDNLLLDSKGRVKLCDFGVSRIVAKNQTLQEQCGTPAYIAPEIMEGKSYSGFQSDIWSLGVLLYTMLIGKVPFKANSMPELQKVVIQGKYEIPPEMTKKLSNEVLDLIDKMLVTDPKKRISIPEILLHPWITVDDSTTCMTLQTGSTMLSKSDLLQQQNSQLHVQFECDQVQAENLFPERYNELPTNNGQEDHQYTGGDFVKIAYQDYQDIVQDSATMCLDEYTLAKLTKLGFSRQLVLNDLASNNLNYGTAAYSLLRLSN